MLDEIIQLKIKLRDMYFQHYMEREFLTATWWLNIALLVIPLIVWWKMVDKSRLLEICVFGLLVNVFAAFLDVAGSDYVLWEYPVHVFPELTLFIPVDYVIVPVVGMKLYEMFPKWKAFIIASTIASALMSFAGEPLAVFLKIYKLITWRYIYSFPIYVVIYSIVKIVTERFVARQRRED